MTAPHKISRESLYATIVLVSVAIAVLIGLVYYPIVNAPSAVPEEVRRRYAPQSSVDPKTGATIVLRSTVELSLGKVFYTLRGPDDGELVVLVHGIALYSFIWEDLANELATKGFRVLTFDYYGRGFSDSPNVAYDDTVFVTQLRELLERVPGIDHDAPVNLLGYSLGGAISTAFTAGYPHRVKRLILLAAAGLPVPVPLAGKVAQLPVVGEIIMGLVGRHALTNKIACYSQELLDLVKARVADQVLYNPGNEIGFVRSFLSTLRNFPLDGRIRADFERVGKLSNLPVLLLWGDADSVVPYANALATKELIPHARLVTLEKAGHHPMMESKEFNKRLIDEVIAFFAAQPRRKQVA